MRPLLFDTVRGAWTNIVRLRTGGVISRHAHPAPVRGYVINGEWPYVERDWRATVGRYVFEPPSDVHILVTDPSESLTLFWITGALIEPDASGKRSVTPTFLHGSKRQRHTS